MHISSTISAKHWKDVAAAKKAHQQTTIPPEWILANPPPEDQLDVSTFPESCGLLSEKEVGITNSQIDELLAKLAGGTWSAVEVTTAFSKRAIVAHQLTNCLTEIFIERALERAAQLDEYLKETGKTMGPLHGLPISLKDQINIKDVESTMGYVSWIGKPASKNSVLADILESLGAVLYVKTNIPQTLMWPETFNNIFGRTTNPYNRSLTSGGSSGGEGALVALQGSPLGVGSDIGGSIRIPSALCGIYGLRPSYGRIPYAGCVNSLEGQDSLPSVLGPMSNSISGIKTFVRSVADAHPWLKDPLAVRKQWSEDEYKLGEHGGGKGLCFAVMWDDGIVRPHPPVIRGMEETKQALLRAGHRVIDWKPLKHDEIVKVLNEIWGAGAAQDYRVVAAISGEPVLTTMAPTPETPVVDVIPTLHPMDEGISAYELWQVQKRRRELRQEYLDHWLGTEKETGTGRPVDAIICPVAPYVAPPHGMYTNDDYATVWNGLDYTSLVIPVSKVDQLLDARKPPHEFYNDLDKANYEMYDPVLFKDAPIAFQLVGKTLEEEAVIAMSEIVDNALKANSSVARGSQL